jgi:hypothetical protein
MVGPMSESPTENLPAEVEPEVQEELVFAEVRPLPARFSPRPAVQTAAVAVTGFVAGAATLALVRRGAQRRPAARPVRPRSTPGGLPIVSSRRYLVDVHVLGNE